MSNEPKETTLSTTESTTYEIITSIESTSESTTEQTTTIASTAKPTEKQTKASTTKRITETQKQTATEKTTAAATSGCENGNHSMSCGNMGKQFDSTSALISYYNSVVNSWTIKWIVGKQMKKHIIKMFQLDMNVGPAHIVGNGLEILSTDKG